VVVATAIDEIASVAVACASIRACKAAFAANSTRETCRVRTDCTTASCCSFFAIVFAISTDERMGRVIGTTARGLTSP
jgi:hypothetical protein